MRTKAFVVTLLSAALPLCAQEKQNVRVLYAGNPADERTADFEQFLGKHFVDVGTIAFEKFTPAAMADYDVVIFDWGKIYFREERALRPPTAPKLPADFDRPMILIGGGGIQIAEHLGARLDWL